ncbi:hypothetical protein D9M68_814830 [compost metagenome]
MLHQQLVGAVAHLHGLGFGTQPPHLGRTAVHRLVQFVDGAGMEFAIDVALRLGLVQGVAQFADLALQFQRLRHRLLHLAGRAQRLARRGHGALPQAALAARPDQRIHLTPGRKDFPVPGTALFCSRVRFRRRATRAARWQGVRQS